ncbi:site-specific integrase [Leuconostoc mesenteroides]|uniref:site-specific integrase n=1 Tax=Leuconostoc mesenteroides TaxID=1245 RepID=UPI00112908AC|nr:tyrosine-type recombinase/integrase [Leuconostoc mesenteroides]TOY71455.1 site-specific integrase [Leuconostoc mesenteroides]
MASIYKRGKTFTVSVSVPYQGGYKKKTKSGFKTKTEANQWAIKTEGSKIDGDIDFKPSQLLSSYISEWIDTYKTDVSRSTHVGYEMTLKAVSEYFENTSLDQVTRHDAQKFLNEYGLSHSLATSQKVKGHLSGILKDAVADGIIRVNPFERAKPHGTNAKDSSLKFLEYTDFKCFIEYLKENHEPTHDIMLVASLSGARLGEVLALTPNDIGNGIINISKSYEERLDIVKEPKTPSSIRTVDVPEWLTDYLLTLSKDDDERLFDRQQSSVNRELQRILTRLDIPKRITFHGLRHSHASMLISQGVAVEYISERLGHKDISITQKTYLHLLQVKRNKEISHTITLLNSL